MSHAAQSLLLAPLQADYQSIQALRTAAHKLTSDASEVETFKKTVTAFKKQAEAARAFSAVISRGVTSQSPLNFHYVVSTHLHSSLALISAAQALDTDKAPAVLAPAVEKVVFAAAYRAVAFTTVDGKTVPANPLQNIAALTAAEIAFTCLESKDSANASEAASQAVAAIIKAAESGEGDVIEAAAKTSKEALEANKAAAKFDHFETADRLVEVMLAVARKAIAAVAASSVNNKVAPFGRMPPIVHIDT
jgi:hypothetical protein